MIQRVVSEAPSVTRVIADAFGTQTDHPMAAIGLIVSQPGADSAVGRPAWVLYESGDIVLRRSRSLTEVEAALLAHLRVLEHAVASPFLAVRQRTLLLPDGTAILADPGGLHELAGLDRRFLGKSIAVLPSTIAAVDVDRCEVVVPDAVAEIGVGPGRYPIRAIWPRALPDGAGELAAAELALVRTIVRHDGLDLGSALSDGLRLFDHVGVSPMSADAVAAAVAGLLTEHRSVRS